MSLLVALYLGKIPEKFNINPFLLPENVNESQVNSRWFLLYLGCFDGTHPALSVRLGRGRADDACLAGGHLSAVGHRIGAESIHSTLEGLLVRDNQPFGSLKKRAI